MFVVVLIDSADDVSSALRLRLRLVTSQGSPYPSGAASVCMFQHASYAASATQYGLPFVLPDAVRPATDSFT